MLKIYKASAGSGKTYTLAFEYIRALLGVKTPGTGRYRLNAPGHAPDAHVTANRHRHILAITFTNKATEEMKRRILDELDALSVVPAPGDTDANYAARLCEEFRCSRQELAQTAAQALRQVLNDYSAFNVATIDSFFQRVLRTFARELDRQGDFNVEINDHLAVQTAVSNMLDDFNTDSAALPALRSWIFDYLTQKLEDGEKTNFFNRNSTLHTDLVKDVSNITEEQFKPYYDDMQRVLSDPANMVQFKRMLSQRKKCIPAIVKADATAVMQALAARGVTTDCIKKTNSIAKIINNNLTQGIAPDKKNFASGSTLYKGAFERSIPYLKASTPSDDDHAMLVDMLARAFRLYVEYYLIEGYIKCADLLSLLGQAWKYLNEFIAQNNIVLLSDTNHLLSRIIGKDDTPFIYERMGVQFRHFLIDEFQDTSRMQWQNLKPLVANGLADDDDSLIIGDEKQSIYRFRNSDSSLLHTQVADEDFPAPDYDTRVMGAAPGENTNYRSSADIVRFNNTLFTRLAASLGAEGFENVVQDIPKKLLDVPGHIIFTPYYKDSKRDDKKVEEYKSLGLTDIDSCIDDMAANIYRQHNQGGYRWSDIAVLVRTNNEGAEIIDRFLSRYPDIPVLSDEALYVRKSPAVQQVVGVLKILANRMLPGSKVAGRKTPAEISTAISRFSYYLGKGLPPDQALDIALSNADADGPGLQHSIEAIESRKPSSLVGLVETIIHEIIPADQLADQMSYLNAFQDFVIDSCSFGNITLKALIMRWDKAKAKLAVSSSANIDAVRVMTVHKSKGLEFDCVHVPFASWAIHGNARPMWLPCPAIEGVDPEVCPPALFLKFTDMHQLPGSPYAATAAKDMHLRMIDTMNMVYVAYTRAARELMVYYTVGADLGKALADAFAMPADTGDAHLCDLAACYEPKTGRLEIGAPTCKIDEKKKPAPDKITISGYKTFYHSDAEVITSVDDMLDTDSDIAADAPRDDDYAIDEAARQRGIVLHDMLSGIRDIGDLDASVTRNARRHRLTPEETAEAARFLRSMLNIADERVHRWFVDNEGVYTEQSIYIPEGSPARKRSDSDPNPDDYRRPDRIVMLPDGSVEVVDYKFTTEMRKSHIRQVSEYVGLLQQMGCRSVSGYLWYPFLSEIKPI